MGYKKGGGCRNVLGRCARAMLPMLCARDCGSIEPDRRWSEGARRRRDATSRAPAFGGLGGSCACIFGATPERAVFGMRKEGRGRKRQGRLFGCVY